MSGPARGRVRATPRPAPAPAVALPQPGLAPRLLEALAGLPDALWLDRLLRGRAWIAIIAFALIGLVFMQVSMLRMNAGIGQKVERAEALERQNADLRHAVSQLSSEERIQRAASAMGLVMPPAGDVTYLRSRGARVDAAKAVKVMRAPDAAAAARQAVAAGAAGAAQTQAATGTSVPPTAAAQQAQQEAAAEAGTVPGAASTGAAPQAQAQAPAAGQGQAQAQAPAEAQAPAQTQAQPQAQAQAAPPTATGATAAPGTGQ